jgi:hypothetical protein
VAWVSDPDFDVFNWHGRLVFSLPAFLSEDGKKRCGSFGAGEAAENNFSGTLAFAASYLQCRAIFL